MTVQVQRRLLLTLALCATAAPRASEGGPSAAIGRRAPPFRLPDSDGRPHDLAEVVRTHRVTVVNFWATWCAPCLKELPEFDAVLKSLAGQRVALLAVNAMESEEKVRAFARKQQFGFPLLVDSEGVAVGDYVGYSAGLPATFLIDARGIVRQRVLGPLDGAALKSRIQALLGAASR